jgi:hypothetical protein
MAILVEEEGNKTNIFKLLIWAGILVVVIVAIYYVFFVNPPLVEVAVPVHFANIGSLGNLTLDPRQVINGPAMSSLKQYVMVPPPDPSSAGRPNPFVPF